MKRRIAIFILASALLALAPAPRQEPAALSLDVLRGYLSRIFTQYGLHPKSRNVIVVTRVTNENADRLDLYVELREDRTLVLTAYAKEKDLYFNTSRAENRERLLQHLLEANHLSFTTFFVDAQGDIGVRFTFTTESGVGFESFRVAVTELLRVADEYTPVLDKQMRKG